MFSLALLVSVIFLLVLLSGPLCFVLSGIDLVPNLIVYILSLITIFLGIWFFLLPITIVRYLGLVSVVLAGMAISNRRGKRIKG